MGLNLQEAFVAVGTRDLDRLVRFYADLVQQEPGVYRAGYAEFQLPGLKLGLFCPKDGAIAAGSSLSLCLEVADLEAAIAHLGTIGFPVSGAILVASHGREIYAADPDGNRLILHQAQ